MIIPHKDQRVYSLYELVPVVHDENGTATPFTTVAEAKEHAEDLREDGFAVIGYGLYGRLQNPGEGDFPGFNHVADVSSREAAADLVRGLFGVEVGSEWTGDRLEFESPMVSLDGKGQNQVTEIQTLRNALEAAHAGFGLARDALKNGGIDEALLHCRHHHEGTWNALALNHDGLVEHMQRSGTASLGAAAELVVAVEQAMPLLMAHYRNSTEGANTINLLKHGVEEVRRAIEANESGLQSAQPRVLVTVSGGIAEYAQDTGVQVELFDFDNFQADKENTPKVPALFADLAAESRAPVENIAGLVIDHPNRSRGHQYSGKVVDSGANYIVLSAGRGSGTIHLTRDLDRVPQVQEVVDIRYGDNHKALVSSRALSAEKAVER